MRGGEKEGGRRRERSWRGGEEQREKEGERGGGRGAGGGRSEGKREKRELFLVPPTSKVRYMLRVERSELYSHVSEV